MVNPLEYSRGTFKQKQLFYAYFIKLSCLYPVKE